MEKRNAYTIWFVEVMNFYLRNCISVGDSQDKSLSAKTLRIVTESFHWLEVVLVIPTLHSRFAPPQVFRLGTDEAASFLHILAKLLRGTLPHSARPRA